MELRKIVLIGRTGDGKSSAGNTILGENVFTTKASANSATAKSESRDGSVHGRKITVIDTPGFFDTSRKDEEIKSEIIKSLVECAPAVHAFVIVLKVGRYTSQENEVVQQFLSTMKGEHVLKHTVILFTHGDQLEGQTIDEFVKPNPQLQELVDKCGGRCHVIDNKHWNDCDSGNKSNRVQVKNLLDTIDTMVKENGCFSNELLKKLEEEIQEEMKKNEDNLPPEEKREKAKKIVHKKFLMQVAGATTGALIGALLGVAVAVAAVLASLKPFCSACKLLKPAKGAAAAAVEAVAAGGGAAAGAAAGGAAAGGAAAGGAAAGGAAAGGGAVTAAETGAAAGAGLGAVKVVAAGAVGVAALAGAVGGGVTGWKAAEEADSLYDAMTKAANLNYKNAKVVVKKIGEFVDPASNNKLEGGKKDN